MQLEANPRNPLLTGMRAARVKLALHDGFRGFTEALPCYGKVLMKKPLTGSRLSATNSLHTK